LRWVDPRKDISMADVNNDLTLQAGDQDDNQVAEESTRDEVLQEDPSVEEAAGTIEEYPEHVKAKAVSEKYQDIASFIDWLTSQGINICRVSVDRRDNGRFYPIAEGVDTLIASYFGIDLTVIAQEQKLILQAIRDLNETGTGVVTAPAS
jgi:hypothetical protein